MVWWEKVQHRSCRALKLAIFLGIPWQIASCRHNETGCRESICEMDTPTHRHVDAACLAVARSETWHEVTIDSRVEILHALAVTKVVGHGLVHLEHPSCIHPWNFGEAPFGTQSLLCVNFVHHLFHEWRSELCALKKINECLKVPTLFLRSSRFRLACVNDKIPLFFDFDKLVCFPAPKILKSLPEPELLDQLSSSTSLTWEILRVCRLPLADLSPFRNSSRFFCFEILSPKSVVPSLLFTALNDLFLYDF